MNIQWKMNTQWKVDMQWKSEYTVKSEYAVKNKYAVKSEYAVKSRYAVNKWIFSEKKNIITFDWNGNFELWWFHRKGLDQIYQNIPYFKLKKYFFMSKIQFLG